MAHFSIFPLVFVLALLDEVNTLWNREKENVAARKLWKCIKSLKREERVTEDGNEQEGKRCLIKRLYIILQGPLDSDHIGLSPLVLHESE